MNSNIQTSVNNDDFWRIPQSIKQHSNSGSCKSKSKSKNTQSRWNKYVHKIHTFIVDDLDGFCMVEKNNVMRRYKTPLRNTISSDGDVVYSQLQFMFECRFQGDPSRKYCNAKLCYIQKHETKDTNSSYYFTYTIFNITEKTPSKLYRKVVQEFDTCVEYNFYEHNGFKVDYLR